MKISVITINYNHKDGLEKTMQSVFSQTFHDFEFIVIDGGSTDGSKELIESFSNKITYWISEPDSGIYNAMNKGIRQAKGEYLHFLNSGDIFASRDVLTDVFDNKEYTSPILRGTQICDFKTYTTVSDNHANQEITLYTMYHNGLRHQATFIKSELFDKYGVYSEDYKIASDWELFFKAIMHGETTSYLAIPIVIFDMSGISNDANQQKLLYEERRIIIEKLLPSTISTDYDRMIVLERFNKQYEQYYYIIDLIKKHSFARFCIKAINKLYKILRIK